MRHKILTLRKTTTTPPGDTLEFDSDRFPGSERIRSHIFYPARQTPSLQTPIPVNIVISIHRRRKEKTKFQTLRYWLDNHLPAAWDQARVSSLRNGYSFNLSPYMWIFIIILEFGRFNFRLLICLFFFRICRFDKEALFVF